MLLTPAGKPDVAARFVLVAHAERTDKHGRGSYPGPAALIAATGYDERTIQRAEIRLRKAGLLIHKGTSHLGTTRWDVDMSKRVGDEPQAEADSRVARRRAQDAERQRSRRERLRAAQAAAENASAIDHGHSESVDNRTAGDVPGPTGEADSIDDPGCTVEGVTDSTSVTSRTLRPDVTDSASGCHGRSAPQTTHEPPMNHPGTIPGGTLPPDPLRPQAPTASGPGTFSEISLSDDADEQPRPETATHDRTRDSEKARTPVLRLIDSTTTTTPTGTRRGFGFCLPCHAEGKTTLAADPVNGAECHHHLRRSAAS
ncbi:hypothetical protein OOJ91_13810 [Micromonospora lupini]|uniref:hypothetical protein n=1 Tax=Micromonospora lupini TaxID=285679 RepID=UPI002255D2FB|nr:hypothetical protein [Micromonospora lupini]MCX5066923.1 hypothetical protein [Micromonospora lupini]